MSERRLKVSLSFLLATLMIFIQMIPMSSGNIKYYYLLGIVIIAVALLCPIYKRNIKLPAFMLIYTITYVLSYVIHFYDDSIRQILMFLIGIFGVRYVVLTGIKTKDELKKFLDLIIIVFAIYAVMGIVESFTSINLFDEIFAREVDLTAANAIRFGLRRNHGMCSISINNGMLLNMILALAGYRLFNTRHRKTVWLIAYILIAIDLILTMSRQVILVGAISQLILAYKCGFTWLAKRLAVIVGVACVAGFIWGNYLADFFDKVVAMFLPLLEIVNPSYSSYYNFDEGIGGIGERTDLWYWIYEAVKSKLIFGMGYETPFSFLMSNNKLKTSIEVHWLYVLYYRGLFGLIGFIVYQVGCLKKILKSKVNLSEPLIGFPFVIGLLSVIYFISLFSCSGWEDLKYYYMIYSVFEAYVRIAAPKLGGVKLLLEFVNGFIHKIYEYNSIGRFSDRRCSECIA